MLNVIRIRLHIKVSPEYNDFLFYYNSDDATFYTVCYLKVSQKKYDFRDMDAFEKDGVYVMDFIFKLPNDCLRSPKLSFAFHIFYQGYEIKTSVQIMEIEIWKDENKVEGVEM